MKENATDSELIESYLEGNKKSLEILIGRYLKQIYNFVARYSGDPAEANDLTQETFIKVWKNLQKFDLDRNFKTWLFTIARNTSLDRIRKKKALPFSALEEEREDFLNQFESEEKLADELFDQELKRETVLKAVATLSPIYQSVIMLRYGENFSFTEIAAILKEPIDTVKSRYRRALIQLRQLLEKEIA